MFAKGAKKQWAAQMVRREGWKEKGVERGREHGHQQSATDPRGYTEEERKEGL